MHTQIQHLLKGCVDCSLTKPLNNKPTGKLMPLQKPSGPWLYLSVDFITCFLLCEGYNAIMVVVDRFKRMVEFLP